MHCYCSNDSNFDSLIKMKTRNVILRLNLPEGVGYVTEDFKPTRPFYIRATQTSGDVFVDSAPYLYPGQRDRRSDVISTQIVGSVESPVIQPTGQDYFVNLYCYGAGAGRTDCSGWAEVVEIFNKF